MVRFGGMEMQFRDFGSPEFQLAVNQVRFFREAPGSDERVLAWS